MLTLKGSNAEKLAAMRELMAGSEDGMKGLDELEELFGYIEASGVKTMTELDLSLARGLSYYTGAIFEVKALDWQIGSIGGGGRYDNLTGIFGLPGLSGVGISFGADRIYDVMKGLGLFPSGLGNVPTLLFANMGPKETEYILPLAAALRDRDEIIEIYPDAAKLKKQFEYADRRSIPFLSITGESEMASGTVNIKNLVTGEQRSFPKDGIAEILEFLK